MNNEEEIEIIDDVGGSEVIDTNPTEPNTMDNNVSSEVDSNQDVSSVFNVNPGEVNNSDVVFPIQESVEENTIVENSIEEPSIFNEVPSDITSNNEEVITNDSISNEDNVDNSINNIVPNEEVTPQEITEINADEVENINNSEVSTDQEEINNEVTISSEEVNQDSVSETEIVNNNEIPSPQVEITNDVIAPSDEVVPQEINNDSIELTNNEMEVQDNNNSQDINNVEVPTPLVENNVTPEENKEVTGVSIDNQVTEEVPQDNITEIKTTAKIQNEAGTTVIGEINGENVSVVSESIPESIDVDYKNNVTKEDKKKKVKVNSGDKKSSPIILALLLVVIIGVGGYFGVTYYMNNSNPNFEVKNVTLELGETIPQTASYYVEGSNVKDTDYNIDLSNVSQEIGTYNYTVTRKATVKTGTIEITDTKGPEVIFKDNLMFAKDSTITKDNLVSSCNDASNCTYELVGTIDTTVAGSQEATINATDGLGNTSTVTTEISIIAKSLVCKSVETLSEDGTYSVRLEDVFYFDGEDKYISSVGKKVTTFVDYGSFFALIKEQENNSEYNFDRKTFSYWVANEVLNKEVQTLDEIKNFYTTNKYTCN